MSNFVDVGKFHKKFGLPQFSEGKFNPAPHALTPVESNFRIGFMREELEEYIDAVEAGDIPGQADALVDLVYVALGTAHMQSFPWRRLWNEVQWANMQKERAVSAEQSKRGSTLDVIKPPGWEGPNIEGILMGQGWRRRR